MKGSVSLSPSSSFALSRQFPSLRTTSPDAEKVREVRRKLEQAGLKTYTQVIDGKDGKRSTRVRVGPFESRDEADKAAARIRKLDLQASVISL